METILIPNRVDKSLEMWQFLLIHMFYLIIFGEFILIADRFSPYPQIGLMGISDILTIGFALFIHCALFIIGLIVCLHRFTQKIPQTLYLKKLFSLRFVSFMVIIHLGLITEVFFRLNGLFLTTMIIYVLSFSSFYISAFFRSSGDVKVLDQTEF